MHKKTDIRLGQLLVQRRACGLFQVNEALRKQQELKERGEQAPLGRLLVSSGAISQDVLLTSLAELGVLQLECPVCHAVQAVATYDGPGNHLCKRCREELVFLDKTPEEVHRTAHRTAMLSASSALSRAAARVPPEESPLEEDEEPPEPESAPAAPPSQKDPFIGKILGGCQVLERIAQGGMGVVYKARQLNLGRTVAVKVLSSELARDASFVRRFIQEARAAAQLNHGNIIHINDVGESQGAYYFTMEFVDGQNLREILRAEGRLPIARAVEIIEQIGSALRHAHKRGVIHRDIKPENIMMTHEGIAKLADLGLAKRVATEKSAGITHAGAILGTPFYMAPEQAKDFSTVDHRSDLYSLGVTFYKMLTGKVPFDGRSPIEVMIKVIDGKCPPIRSLRPEVPPDLESIVGRMMHPAPDERYQDVEDMLKDLARASVTA